MLDNSILAMMPNISPMTGSFSDVSFISSKVSLAGQAASQSLWNSSEVEITDDESAVACTELREWCRAATISNELIRLSVRLWRELDAFPTLDYIVTQLHRVGGCLHLRALPSTLAQDMIRHFLIYWARVPMCPEVDLMHQYYTLHGELPTVQELEETSSRTSQFRNDPVSFYHNDRLRRPVANLDRLEAAPLPDGADVNCGICQENISKGQMCYTLAPCGHRFHSVGSECLDGNSIINWLQAHKICPLCRCEIDAPAGPAQSDNIQSETEGDESDDSLDDSS
jgi:hypothetical protein